MAENSEYRVVKFGGTSLATRVQIEKAIDIMIENPSRRFLVVSAPGSRYNGDIKITDLLIRCAGGSYASESDVVNRLKEIAPDLPKIVQELSEDLRQRLTQTNAPNYQSLIKSFGEYASARIVTEIIRNKGISVRFADPKGIGFRVKRNGDNSFVPDSVCYEIMERRLLSETPQITVIPGFYGYTNEGLLETLARGGSDTSGAVIANAVNARIYENWTDEDGIKRADPKIVPEAEVIPEMTYREARELAYYGFKLQETCLIPLESKKIPLNVRNTSNPDYQGTMIVRSRIPTQDESILGIASKKGYVPISIHRFGMNEEVGFFERTLDILRSEGVSYDHSPTGIDNVSMLIHKSQFTPDKSLDYLAQRLRQELPDSQIEVGNNVSLLAVAGVGIRNHPETLGRVINTMGVASITPRILIMDESIPSFFLGVNESQSDDAVRAIHQEYFGK